MRPPAAAYRDFAARRNLYDRIQKRHNPDRSVHFEVDDAMGEGRGEMKPPGMSSASSSLLQSSSRPPHAGQGMLSRRIVEAPIFPEHLCKNLQPRPNDSSDTKCIKLVLESMISQVCRWDKHYGWARKIYLKQNEIMISENIDHIRKEINKRRSELESRAEAELGVSAPWRRSRGRPSNKRIDLKKAKEQQQQQQQKNAEQQQMINPADISLSGDDWGQKPIKQEEETANGDSQRADRDTSKKVSSDDESDSGGILMHIPPHEARSRGRPRKEEGERRRKEAEEKIRKLRAEGSDVRNMIDPTELHCICRQPFDDRKFYVACSQCSQWFHGKCIGLSEKRAKRLCQFICHDCRAPENEDSEMEGEAFKQAAHLDGADDEEVDIEGEIEQMERERARIHVKEESHDGGEEEEEEGKEEEEEPLYCICHTPYDDTKFYVGCDNCPNWFHPSCVGITEIEAQTVEKFLCPDCTDSEGLEQQQQQHHQQGPMDEKQRKLHFLWDLYDAVSQHQSAWPFLDSIDTEEFSDYDTVVKNPIDLSKIEQKLSNGAYSNHIELHADLQLMITNAKQYHQKTSDIYKCAETLDAVIKNKLDEVYKRK
ncbi:unnamed protein product, partial [Mesorhabditis spiculigera]